MRVPARILDMDGTLVNVSSVRHFVLRVKDEKDFDSFHAASLHCPPNQQAIDYAIETVNMGMAAVVVTARMDRWYDLSRQWLDKHMPVPYDGPFMRQDGNYNGDDSVKSEILRYLMRHYDIRGAIDDNPTIIRLWEKHGIPVTVVPGWDDEASSNYARLAKRP